MSQSEKDFANMVKGLKAEAGRLTNEAKAFTSDKQTTITVSPDICFAAERFAQEVGNITIKTNAYLPHKTWVAE